MSVEIPGFTGDLEDVLDLIQSARHQASYYNSIRFEEKDKNPIFKAKKSLGKHCSKGSLLVYVREDIIKCQTTFWTLEEIEITMSWNGSAYKVEQVTDMVDLSSK